MPEALGPAEADVAESFDREVAGRRKLSESEFEEIYLSLFQRLVRRASWKHGLPKEDAAEVVQDAFVLALAKLSPEGNPQSWLYRVVDNLAVNWSRKVERHTRILATWQAEGRSAAADHDVAPWLVDGDDAG